MFIDKYDITVIGTKWNYKKEKHEGEHSKLRVSSEEGINHKKLIPLIEDIEEAHNGYEIEISVIIRQQKY